MTSSSLWLDKLQFVALADGVSTDTVALALSMGSSKLRGIFTLVRVFWDHFEVGPSYRLGDGVQVASATSYEIPVALRLDFGDAPVWFVAGKPEYPDMTRVLIPGDEILVAFEAQRLQAMGLPDDKFTGSSPAPTRRERERSAGHHRTGSGTSSGCVSGRPQGQLATSGAGRRPCVNPTASSPRDEHNKAVANTAANGNP
jgi:hypothetical protein